MNRALSAAIFLTMSGMSTGITHALPLEANPTLESSQYHEWYDTNAERFHSDIPPRSNSNSMNWQRDDRRGKRNMQIQTLPQQTPVYPPTDHRP
jgi:hypothetical protein